MNNGLTKYSEKLESDINDIVNSVSESRRRQWTRRIFHHLIDHAVEIGGLDALDDFALDIDIAKKQALVDRVKAQVGGDE